jgi:zinc transporter ZupT
MKIAIFLFSSWSLANLILHGTIFKPLRVWFLIRSPFIGGMLSCMMCFSFWTSFTLSILINLLDGVILYSSPAIDILVSTLCGSGFSYILDLVIWRRLIETEEFNKPERKRKIKSSWKKI